MALEYEWAQDEALQLSSHGLAPSLPTLVSVCGHLGPHVQTLSHAPQTSAPWPPRPSRAHTHSAVHPRENRPEEGAHTDPGSRLRRLQARQGFQHLAVVYRGMYQQCELWVGTCPWCLTLCDAAQSTEDQIRVQEQGQDLACLRVKAVKN